MEMKFSEKMLLVLLEKSRRKTSEFTKLKIQQFLFEAQCGETLFQSQDSFIPSATPVQTPLTAPLQHCKGQTWFAHQFSQLQNEYN